MTAAKFLRCCTHVSEGVRCPNNATIEVWFSDPRDPYVYTHSCASHGLAYYAGETGSESPISQSVIDEHGTVRA